MRHFGRLAVAGMLATVALALAASTSAAAEVIEISEPTFIDTWSSLTFRASGVSVSCPVTLEGSFTATTFRPTAGTRIGEVRRVTIGTCRGGRIRALTEGLPWAVDYHSFAGTLPEITSVTLDTLSAGFKIETETATCELRTSEREPLRIAETRERNGALTETRLDESVSYALGGGAACELARPGHFSEAGSTSGIREEGEETRNQIVVWQQGAANMLREELGGVLQARNFARGGQTSLSMTRGVPHVRVTIIREVPFGLRSERFAFEFGGVGRCQTETNSSTIMPQGGCTATIRSVGAAEATASNAQIEYRVGLAANPIEIQSFGLSTN